MGLELYCKSGKFLFDTFKFIFGYPVAGFHGILNDVLVVEGCFKILIKATKVSILDFRNIIQPTANAVGQLCLMCSNSVGRIQHIGRRSQQWPSVGCLLIMKFLNLRKGGFLLLLQLLQLCQKDLEFCVARGGSLTSCRSFALSALLLKLQCNARNYYL